jgi:hypothetical protein
MMRCKTCYHEYTAFDFVTLRNLCEHLYLDSLAQKQNPSLPSSAKPFDGCTISHPVGLGEVTHSESPVELVFLE